MANQLTLVARRVEAATASAQRVASENQRNTECKQADHQRPARANQSMISGGSYRRGVWRRASSLRAAAGCGGALLDEEVALAGAVDAQRLVEVEDVKVRAGNLLPASRKHDIA